MSDLASPTPLPRTLRAFTIVCGTRALLWPLFYNRFHLHLLAAIALLPAPLREPPRPFRRFQAAPCA